MKFSLLIVLVLGFWTLSVALDYQTQFTVNANGSPIELSVGHANPLVTDWSGDGVKDLIIGQYSGAKLRYYVNSGSNEAPVFTTFTYLQADGSDISLSSG